MRVPAPLIYAPPLPYTIAALLQRRTVYGPGCLGGGWYDASGREIIGLGLFFRRLMLPSAYRGLQAWTSFCRIRRVLRSVPLCFKS